MTMSDEFASLAIGESGSGLRSLVVTDSRGQCYAWSSSSQRLVSKSLNRNEEPSSTSYICSPPIDFSVTQIAVSRSGSYAALAGYTADGALRLAVTDLAFAEPSPTDRNTNMGATKYILRESLGRSWSLRMVKLAFHPDSDSHVAILTSDSRFRMVDVALDSDTAETDLRLSRGATPSLRSPRPGVFGLSFLQDHDDEADDGNPSSSSSQRGRIAPDSHITSFAFAPKAPGWLRMTAFFLTDAGAVHVACPVAPTPLRLAYATSEPTTPENGGWDAPNRQPDADPEFGEVQPGAVDWTRTPELQGPLEVLNEAVLPGGSTVRPYTDLAVLHPSPECVVVAVSTASGYVKTHVLAGTVTPSWPPTRATSAAVPSRGASTSTPSWSFQTPARAAAAEGFKISRNPFFGSPATPDLFGKRRMDATPGPLGLSRLGNQEQSGPHSRTPSMALALSDGEGGNVPPPPLPKLVTIDLIPTLEFRSAEAPPGPTSSAPSKSSASASSTAAQEDRANATSLLSSPSLPETLCLVHRHGIIGIRLAWAYLVASFLRQAAADESADAATRLLKDLPEPAVAELLASPSPLIGAALFRGNYGSAAALAVEATGKSYRVSADVRPTISTTAMGSPTTSSLPAAGSALPATGALSRVPESSVLATLRGLCKDAQAEYDRVMDDYASIARGPDVPPSPTVHSDGKMQGPEADKFLQEWSLYFKKRFATYLESSHMIIEERTAEMAAVAAEDAKRGAALAQRVAVAQKKRQALQLRLETAVKLQSKLVEHVRVLQQLMEALPRPLTEQERMLMVEVSSADLDRRMPTRVAAVCNRAADLHEEYRKEKERESRVARVLGGAPVEVPRTELLRSLRRSELLLSQADTSVRKMEGAVRERLEEDGAPMAGGGLGREEDVGAVRRAADRDGVV